MQNIKLLILSSVLCCMTISGFSQNLNWAALKSHQKNIVHINTGWDYGMVYGAGYSYQLKYKMPVLLNMSYSFPSGKKLLDDFKIKTGGQVRLLDIQGFQLSASVYGVYRRYQNPLVSLQNFGSEMTGVIGYYKPKWFVAGEVGFDKAIVTHFKHSESFRENIYQNAKDGWYQPATGGNFNYGIQTGYSLNPSDIIFKLGKVLTQDYKTTPLIPYYLQLSYNVKLGKQKEYIHKNE